MTVSDVIGTGLERNSLEAFGTSRSGWISFAALILVLASLFSILIWFAQRTDDALPEFQRRFEELRNVEARWDTGILALQLGLAANYDNVSDSAKNLKFGLDDLISRAVSTAELKDLSQDLKTYERSIAQKTTLFQQVKASHSMLRNAVSVLPSAISACYKHPDVMANVEDTNKRVSDLITESVNGIMSFLISPTPFLEREVDDRLTRLRSAKKTAPMELAGDLDRLLAQIDVVVRERAKGNRLSLQLNAVATSANADVVIARMRELRTGDQTLKSDLWLAAIALGALLFGAFLGFLHLSSRRFLKLSRDNVVLQQANENVEEQLLQSAKLSALGQMVAGITHEINTPLAYVRAVFELIRERLIDQSALATTDAEFTEDDGHEELVMLLDDGLHGLNEIATLVRTMKNFSRLDKGTIESFSVEDGLESALLLARAQLKYVADVKREFDGVPPIMASPTQLRQVFLNLIINAADAMAVTNRRGTLTLRTFITSSDTVQIQVCDDGAGISEENLAKIFDPFFTTKAVGHGTGMGLSICYRIVENHGGTIAISSKVGKGTVITVTLPRRDVTFASQPDVFHNIDQRPAERHKET